MEADNTANGNEAVLECNPGSFCCDTNRPELSGGQACCDASPVRFSLDGNVAMTAMSEAPASSTAMSSSLQSTSSTQITSTSLSSQTTSNPSATSVVVVTSVFSDNGKETVTTIPKDSNAGSHTLNMGAVIGGSVAAAIALIAIITLSFLLLRRQRGRNPPRVFRNFSLKDGLDPMYHDRRSLKSLFKSDTPSELIGSVPDLHAGVDEKNWEKQYESPGDIGKVTLLNPQRSAKDLPQVSPLSQSFSNDHHEPTELPAQSHYDHSCTI